MTLPAKPEDLPVPQFDNLPPALASAFANGSPMQQMLGQVLDELGGLDAVIEWAEDNMGDFMRMIMAANPPPVSAAPPGGNVTHLHVHPALEPGPLDTHGVTIEQD